MIGKLRNGKAGGKSRLYQKWSGKPAMMKSDLVHLVDGRSSPQRLMLY